MEGHESTTAAHSQTYTVHFRFYYPEHEARGTGPQEKAFRAAKKRLKKLGIDKCVVCGAQPVEFHHDKVEFSLQNGIDIAKFNAHYGLSLSDEQFRSFISSPGNLESLCQEHHRGRYGVHSLPAPFWTVLRDWKDDTPPPAEVIHS